jgi:hypothetical protein
MNKQIFQVGDLILIKNILPRPRPLPRPHPRRCPLLHPRHRLNNTHGIITAFEKHTDIFTSDSTEDDNGYIWFSQVDGKEYYFYENEVEGEVVK